MGNSFQAVILGDVINSRKLDQTLWLPKLKEALSGVGESPKDWDIYRGDAFQLVIDDPMLILQHAIRIKAEFKCRKGFDVRMAIGIGQVDVRAERVSESNGQAFVLAGQLIDQLSKRNTSLALASPWSEFNAQANASLAMAAVLMDRWLPNYAEVVAWALKEPQMNQKTLGEKMGITQNTVSERQSRAYKKVLLDYEAQFKKSLAVYLIGAG